MQASRQRGQKLQRKHRVKASGAQSESIWCVQGEAHLESRIHRYGWTRGEAARVGWAVPGFGHQARCVWGSPFWQGIQLQGPSGGPLGRG